MIRFLKANTHGKNSSNNQKKKAKRKVKTKATHNKNKKRCVEVQIKSNL